MSTRVKRREPCSHDDCGSRRFHVGDDGYTYCDQGHQQSELGTVVAEDTGEFIKFGKTSRKQDSDVESVASKASGFRGTRAIEHYLLCLQLILRKQIRWLIDIQKLPQEFEVLVRDLWALRLRRLHTENALPHDWDTDTEARSTQGFSSHSEGDSATDAETATSHRSLTGDGKKRRIPTLVELLSLNYVGMLLLRLPATVNDILQMTNSGEIPYYRANREVPRSMKDRLPATYQEMLEAQSLLAPEMLHRSNLRLITLLDADFGMAVPQLNHPLILYRWVKQLALPLEVYIATQRLARELEVGFGYSTDAAPRASIRLRFPEARLMALIVIATKLLFPFDTCTRYPTAASNLAALAMDWQAWVAADAKEPAESTSSSSAADQPPLSFEEAFRMTEAESLDLVGDRLDDYLDWCERNIASEEIREGGKAGKDAEFRRALFSMFPVSSSSSGSSSSSSSSRSKRHGMAKTHAAGGHSQSPATAPERSHLHTQRALMPKRIVPAEQAEGPVPRPGSSYVQYRDPAELEGPSDAFHRKAAAVAGLSLYGLVRAVFVMEKKLRAYDLDLHQRDQQ